MFARLSRPPLGCRRGTNQFLTVYMQYSTTNTSTKNPIPANFLRGGTSKGIFLNRDDLPAERSQWDPIFLGIMGSPDPEHGRQLNGMGGGISSLSKICIVGSPTTEQRDNGIDAEYTFAQIGIRDSSIDYSGNCGNLSSMIGVFAFEEGMCKRPVGGTHATIRSFNTNTQKIIDTTFPISDNAIANLEIPEATLSGVPGKSSPIVMEFVNPGGARTGKLLPTGKPIDIIKFEHGQESKYIHVSLIDATNPTVFVDYQELNNFLPVDDYIKGTQSPMTEVLEGIRKEGAKLMGLDPNAQAQPKIAFLSEPGMLGVKDDQEVDIFIHALSMGVLHKAVPMTVALCLGVASKTPGTIAQKIVARARLNRAADEAKDLIRLQHSGGFVDVGAEFDTDTVKSAKVVNTGRRLMKGVVWW